MLRNPENKKQKGKLLRNIILATLATVIALSAALVVYAYFRTQVYVYTNDGEKKTFEMGLELNTFFDMIDGVADGTSLGIACTDTSSGTLYTSGDMADNTVYYVASDTDSYVYVYNEDAKWGSASNPYIISRKAHLQNLYVLQNCGYFNQFISGAKESSLPYFLVCDTDGTPATIDCTDAEIEPIGNENYPFIGYLGGNFTEGTTVADGTENGKTSTQSVIYNATIKTDEDVIDVGLFGHIGYLKDEDSNITTTNGVSSFTGTVSVVRDLLLYDVKIVVDTPSILDKIAAAIANHLFSYKNYNSSGALEETGTSTPHENHHIGILAGHVELGTVEYISVYYSNTDIAAIDVSYGNTTVDGNFKSVSGILGFCYEMNSVQSNGTVTIGGISNEDIEVSGGGVGTGGGLLSGTGRGYVTASEIFEGYKYSGKFVDYKVTDSTTEETIEYSGLLVIAKTKSDDEGATATYGDSGVVYSLQDGTEVEIEVENSKNVAKITSTYVRFIVDRETTDTWEDFVVQYTDGYYHLNYQNKKVDDGTVTDNGIYLRFAASSNGTALCTQYVRERTLVGEEVTQRYYFYDGVFTFALSDAEDTIVSTWDDSSSADIFAIGEDDASQWEPNVAEGAEAVISYLKPITSTSALDAAITANKKLVIISKQNSTNNLVKLSETPDLGDYTDGDGICHIASKDIPTLSDDINKSLKTAFTNGTLTMADISGKKGNVNVNNVDELLANWNSYYMLYFGADISDTASLTEVESDYMISATGGGSKGVSYSMTGGDYTVESVTLSSDNKKLTENRDETKVFTGFFYAAVAYSYETKASSSRKENVQTKQTFTFTYYFVNLNEGTVETITTGKSSSVSRSRDYDWWWGYSDLTDHFPSNAVPLGDGGTSNGAQMYSYESGGTTYKGPLLYKINDSYFSSYGITELGEDDYSTASSEIYGVGSATVDGAVCSIGTIGTYNYTEFVIKTGDIYTYYKDGASTEVSTKTGQGASVNGRTTYNWSNNSSAILVIRESYGVYTFYSVGSDNNTRYLRIEQRKALLTDYMYTLWCSTNDEHDDLSNWTVTYKTSTDGYVTFNESDGSCTIRYTYDQNRYLNFDGSGTEGIFNGTSDASASTAVLYIYSYEGSQKASYGHVTYDPVKNNSGVSTGISFSASDYVLWPNEVYNEATGAYSAYEPKATGKNANATTYTVKSLQALYNEAGSGWKTGSNDVLSYDSLKKAFNLTDNTSQISIYTILNGNAATSQEYVRAPIGTTGEEAYIPTGCVAFRVNESGEQKIRVIVSCPCTMAYYGETVGSTSVNPLDYENDYYFCLWNLPQAGDSTTTSISFDNCIQGFALPRSNTYAPGKAITDANNSYITVTYNNESYRCYLNGDRVLIAYEFVVEDIGVYVLGSNHACEIVYFSADSTASSGNDGSINYKMGNIDFVYDNAYTGTATKVITVRDTDYVASCSVLYTDNAGNRTGGALSTDTGDAHTVEVTSGDTTAEFVYPNIRNFTIYVQRTRTKTTKDDVTTYTQKINWSATGPGTVTVSETNYVLDACYIDFARYSYSADEITRAADAVRTSP